MLEALDAAFDAVTEPVLQTGFDEIIGVAVTYRNGEVVSTTCAGNDTQKTAFGTSLIAVSRTLLGRAQRQATPAAQKEG